MSKKITEMVEKTELVDTDWLTGIDNAAAAAAKNIKIRKANLHNGLALESDLLLVASDLASHEATTAKTAHPDGIGQIDLDAHKADFNQHPIAGVTGLQAALDAKEDTANLGDAAYRDVGTGSGDVASGSAPGAAVSAHDTSPAAHGSNIPTTAQKAALDGNATLSGANPVASMADLGVPGPGSTLSDYGEEANNLGPAITGTQDISLAAGMVHYGDMVGDTTFTFSNPTAHAATSFTLLLGTGGFSPTFPVTWAGSAPDLSADATYLLAFFLINGTWYGVLAG